MCSVLFLFLVNCEQNREGVIYFRSDFGSINKNIKKSPEYYLNSINDWQVIGGKIECLVSDKNRNVFLLSRELPKDIGSLEMKVRLGFYNKTISSSNKNWGGFSIGFKRFSNTKKSKEKPFSKSSINIGVCTNGTLFIGEPGLNQNNYNIINVLDRGLDLIVSFDYIKGKYTIDVALLDVESGTVLGRISKNNVPATKLAGNIALVSDFENETSTKNQKSVWFQDWIIQGSKLNAGTPIVFNN